jgi:hypothetical protein
MELVLLRMSKERFNMLSLIVNWLLFSIKFLILLTKILVGPVGVTFAIVDPDFQLLSKRSEKDVFDPDPIGSPCEGRDPNHAVTIVGYAKDGLQGKDYW